MAIDPTSAPDTAPDTSPPPDVARPPTPVAPVAGRFARFREKPPTASRWLGRLMTAALWLWIIAVAFGAQTVAWLSAATTSGRAGPIWLQATWLEAALLAAPLAILAGLWRTPRYRAIFRTWLWAALFVAVMAPTRLLPPVEAQTALLLQFLITLGALIIARRWMRRRPPLPAYDAPDGRWLALAVGGTLTLPWVIAGALGGGLDILLAVLLGISVAALAWAILGLDWLPTLRMDARGPRRDRFTAGLVAGTTLLILASALSLNGVQIWLMIGLPAAAWAALASAAPVWTLAVAVAAPLAFIDADVTNLIAGDDLLLSYLQAAGSMMLLGWLLGLAGVLARPTLGRVVPRALALGVAAVVILALLAFYWGVGQPGLYGDRLFVVLDSQADLSAAAQISDVDERRRAVYTALTAHADTTQADLRRALDRLGLAYTPYYLVNAIEVEGGLPVRLWLSLRPEVDRVLPSPTLRPTADPLEATTGGEPPPTEPVWNVTTIGADRAWRDFGARGQGIIIGQSDSGVQFDHPAFAARYQGAQESNPPTHDYHWFDPWYGSTAPVDYDGHGTHTLGTVLGEQIGVAPDATWIACANLVRNLGNPARYLDCMQFMLAPFPLGGDPFRDGDPARAADVLNNSWGCPQEYEGCDAQVFAPAVAALRAAGIFVVASAGNSGPLCGTVADPIALYDAVVTVGAVDRAGNLATFSSAGPVTVDGSGRIKPDLAAPGVDILSAFPNSSYATASGTSMAGPHVAGVVALMWSANPALIGDIDRTETLLLEAAHPFTGALASPLTPEEREELAEVAGEESLLIDLLAPAPDPDACLYQVELDQRPNNAAGYGVVDAYRAVELARSAQPGP